MPRETDAPLTSAARRLVRTCRSAALATAFGGKRAGWPYASLVSAACDLDGSPILLLSGLADHTRNLASDDRASLLFEAASGLANPQTGPRVSLTGHLHVTGDEKLARRFLARHPGARRYAGFKDFSFYKMTVERAHFVGGFGSARWLGASEFLFETDISQAVSRVEVEIIDNLNKQHGPAITVAAHRFFGSIGKTWQVTGVDLEGCDFRCRQTFRRHDFDEIAGSDRALRKKLSALVDIL